MYEFTDEGLLLGEYDGTWLAIDDQPIAYYYEQTQTVDGEELYFGYVPVLLEGERAELLLCTDSRGVTEIAGARRVYDDGETETIAKADVELNEGDEILFLCQAIDKNGRFEDTYPIAEWRYHAGYVIENVPLVQDYSAVYLLTDIYNNAYWTEELP